MKIALLTLVFVSAPRPAVSTELPYLRARFLKGDLYTVERAAAQSTQGGETGALGLLIDLGRLVRCLPLGAVPKTESPKYSALRSLVRLERIRLERIMRDGLHPESPLVSLLGNDALYQTVPNESAKGPALVRWPLEDERWPDEVQAPPPLSRACPDAPSARKEKKDYAQNRALRDLAERRMITVLLGKAKALPKKVAAKIALAYLAHLVDVLDAGASLDRVRLDKKWRDTLSASLRAGPSPYRTAGLLRLARLSLLEGNGASAMSLLDEVLSDETRSDEEDGWARTQLVYLLEPPAGLSARADWERVLEVAQAARRPRAQERWALMNARARALFALGRIERLMQLGRVFMRRAAQADDVFATQTELLLFKLSLSLPPAEAIAWVQELYQGRTAQLRLETLAQLAQRSKRLTLATAIYDYLLTQAEAQKGPRAISRRVHYLAARAAIEYDRRDTARFGGFLDQIVEVARLQQDRPLARIAPHREMATLVQRLMGRMVQEKDERQPKFAALLLQAIDGLGEQKNRYTRTLRKYGPPLRRIAGPWARRKPRREESKVRQIGQVTVPRLPPRLSPPDLPLSPPKLGSFLTYEAPGGKLINGVPWKDRLEASLVP